MMSDVNVSCDTSCLVLIACDVSAGGGGLTKISDGDAWPHWSLFSTCSHQLTHFSTRSYLLTPFLMIHNKFSTIFHWMIPPFDNISLTCFRKFYQKCFQICILPGQLVKICLILIVWPPFLLFSPNDDPLKKNLSPNDRSLELLSAHPRHF